LGVQETERGEKESNYHGDAGEKGNGTWPAGTVERNLRKNNLLKSKSSPEKGVSKLEKKKWKFIKIQGMGKRGKVSRGEGGPAGQRMRNQGDLILWVGKGAKTRRRYEKAKKSWIKKRW